jgi:2,4-dienoyl-CoA reductase-like NADH-dependent reductase (Old Yellow Enzyme family)/thioredoxin reductase
MAALTKRFTKLFEPMKIGNIDLKNRIIMPAMATNYGHRDGTVSSRLIHYYKRRARGGASLIIVEPACVDYPRGKGLINQLDISTDHTVNGLASLAKTIRQAGAVPAIQLHHAGWLKLFAEPVPIAPFAPSTIRYRGFDTPLEVSVQEIDQWIQMYVDAAVRAKTAGFQAIEYHGAHGYGIAQFMSPRTNLRTDEYGGTLEKRTRFFTEIMSRTRDRLGKDFPIFCRIDADEYADDGITITDSCMSAEKLERSGASAIHVSVNSTPGKSSREIVSNVPPMGYPDGTWVHLAEKMKCCVHIPVIAVGKIHRPEMAEEILASKKADLIAVGRQMIADPEWPKKVWKGRLDDIRPCIACNCCIREVTRKKSDLICAVNPEAGREEFVEIAPQKTKRVLIFGAGPAGMQAAATAADRGHHTEIWEAESEAGGQLRLAAIPPGKDILLRLKDFLRHEIIQKDIPLRFSVNWSSNNVADYRPDVIILATGSRAVLPNIPGIDSPNVTSVREILSRAVEPGERVLIVGGGASGCEVADFLINISKSILLIEQTDHLAGDMDPMRGRRLLNRLRKAGVNLKIHTELLAVNDSRVLIGGFSGKTETLEIDTVIVSTEPKSNRDMLNNIENLSPEVFVIGDACRPGGILNAISEGWMVGRRI